MQVGLRQRSTSTALGGKLFCSFLSDAVQCTALNGFDSSGS